MSSSEDALPGLMLFTYSGNCLFLISTDVIVVCPFLRQISRNLMKTRWLFGWLFTSSGDVVEFTYFSVLNLWIYAVYSSYTT